jgi:hypothetical protein
LMCVFMSDKPFDAKACDIGGHASATNGLSDMKTPFKTHHVIDPSKESQHNIIAKALGYKQSWTTKCLSFQSTIQLITNPILKAEAFGKVFRENKILIF